MKYLHSGYILFCDRAEHSENGRVNTAGLFDLFVSKSLPVQMKCDCVIGFGTPYERRQYKGTVTIEDADGKEIFSQEFNANDPNNLFKGHYIFKTDLSLDHEGSWVVKVVLKNWKNESVWEIQRQFWAMIEPEAHPDP